MGKTKKKDRVHVLIALDSSGSMYELAEDVRGAFNQYLDGLAEDGGDDVYRVTVFMFDHKVWEHCTDEKPSEAPRLTERNYYARGNTALRDAIGRLVASVEDDGKARHLVVVNTDGKENSSLEWSHEKVAKLVADKKATGRWDFVFLGAAPDAWQQGQGWGMSSAETRPTRDGTYSLYSGLGAGTKSYAAGASGQSVTATASAYSMTGLPPQEHEATGPGKTEEGEA